MKHICAFSWLQRLLCLLIGLYVLNFSVDPPDQHLPCHASGKVQEDLSINKMESIGEWVLEHVFNIDIAEQDEPDEDKKTSKSSLKLSLPQRLLFQLLPAPCVELATLRGIPFTALPYVSQTREIYAPPPRLV